mgnify:CR=1 FL=1
MINFPRWKHWEQLSSALENKNTVIEVFGVGPSQVDYLLALDKAFALDDDSEFKYVTGETTTGGIRRTGTDMTGP